jgi:hypothetical protein
MNRVGGRTTKEIFKNDLRLQTLGLVRFQDD